MRGIRPHSGFCHSMCVWRTQFVRLLVVKASMGAFMTLACQPVCVFRQCLRVQVFASLDPLSLWNSVILSLGACTVAWGSIAVDDHKVLHICRCCCFTILKPRRCLRCVQPSRKHERHRFIMRFVQTRTELWPESGWSAVHSLTCETHGMLECARRRLH